MMRTNAFVLAACAVALLISPVARARDEPTLSLRDAAALAPTIVEADLVSRVGPHGGLAGADPEKPSDLEFKITRVLRGPLTVGKALTLEFRYDYVLAGDADGGCPQLRKALLFLKPCPGREGIFSRVELHYLDDGNCPLTPKQGCNPGPRILTPREGVTWDQFMRQADAEIAATDAVLALREVPDPARRNQAIFRWIDNHKQEFGTPAGWGPLERMVFEWVLDTQIPEDCWRASALRVELGRYGWFADSGCAFATPDGRELLARIALDQNRDPHERVRALANLGHGPVIDPYDGHGVPSTRAEFDNLLKALRPLLAEKDEDVATYAKRAIDMLERRAGWPRPAGSVGK